METTIEIANREDLLGHLVHMLLFRITEVYSPSLCSVPFQTSSDNPEII